MVLPHVLKKGTRPYILCKSRIDQEIEVAVYSADGKEKKLTLHKGPVKGGLDGMAGQLCIQWDGADPSTKAPLPKGEYRMRWTVPDGYRELPVSISE